MMTDPPLTPMERRLLEALQRIETDWQAREERLGQQIADLQTQLQRQNEAIGSLQALLRRLLISPDLPPSRGI